MKLTKKQRDELFNWHEGAGFLWMKSRGNEIIGQEFYTDAKGKIRCISDSAPLLDLNEFVKNKG